MKHFIFQGNNHDCGFASLKMLLCELSHDDSYLNISKPSKKEKFSVLDLEDIADSFGVKLESCSCDQDYYDKLKCPCITMIQGSHMVMVKKRTSHFILLYDPGRGIRLLTRKQFFKIWEQVIIEVVDSSSIQKIKKINREVLPKKMRLFQAGISLASVLLLIAGFYYLNDNNNFLFSVLFLFLFALTQFLESYLIYKQINYFDETYIPLYFKQEQNNNENKYKTFQNFKANYFVSSRSLLASALMAFTIVFLLCFNDFRNILILVLLILVKLLDIILSQKSTKLMFETVDEYEKKGLENLTSNYESILKANKYSNEKVFKDSVKGLLYMSLCFALAVFMMFLTGNSGCNFVIFHFVIYFVGYKSFSELLEGLSLRKRKEQEECRFFDDCNL